MKNLLMTSKLIIAIALIFSILSTNSYSQSTHLKLLINEVNSNFNYGKSNSDLKSFKKDARGILIGASFQAGITRSFSMVTEAYFTMKGAKLKSGNQLTGNKSTVRLYSAELPVLARLHIGHFYTNSGPYVSYNITGTSKVEGSEELAGESKSVSFHDVPGGYKRWEMGLQAGIGYNFRIKKSTVSLDLRYGYGLTNISRDAEKYNRTLNISIIAYKAWKTNPFSKKQF